tara:strand:- start:359 stop:721 length:363 start_codon:yes stop_codon:yes gene_type:complete
MGQNSTEVAYGFGQLGSVFSDEAVAVAPPAGKVIIAMTFLEDTVLGAMVADVAEVDGSNNGTAFFGSATAPAGTTGAYGTGAAETDTATLFPAGLTVYGRWTSVTPPASTTGGVIFYFGI